jgi:hypothetical protein
MNLDDWHDDYLELQCFVRRWHGIAPRDAPGIAIGRATSQSPLVLWRFQRDYEDSLQQVVRLCRLLPIDRLDTGSKPVVFCVENQGVYLWAAEDLTDNPRIVSRFNDTFAQWVLEAERMCRFLLQLCIYEAVQWAPFGAQASWCPESVMQQIELHFSPSRVGAWRWPEYPTRFFETDNALAVVTPNSGGFSIQCGGRTGDSLQCIADLVDDSWEYVRLC